MSAGLVPSEHCAEESVPCCLLASRALLKVFIASWLIDASPDFCLQFQRVFSPHAIL